jgi:hypothetical protein
MRRKLIIAFDSWTGGMRHFDRLHAALQHADYRLTLYHTESWQPRDARPGLASSAGVETIDIGDYAGNRLLARLRDARPQAVLFLSIDTFAHRAVNRYCRYLGIPTLWLNHGLASAITTRPGTSFGMHPVGRIKYLVPRVWRLIARVLPTYVAALRFTRAPLSDWLRIPTDIGLNAVGRYVAVNPPDSRCTAAAVYTEADRDQAMRRYWHTHDEVIAVGNPDLMDFSVRNEDVGALVERHAPATKELIYVDSRLIHYGMGFASDEAFVDHLEGLREAAERYGYSLALKLHPGHAGTSIPARLTDRGFILLNSGDLSARLLRAAACVVEPSTASVVPALLGLPILPAKFGSLSAIPFGPLLESYPRAAELFSLDDLDATIARLWRVGESDELRRWIGANSGPMPSEQFPARVADLLSELTRRMSGAEA